MADQTPQGPRTSGRIAGVIALVALILGLYYAVTAGPIPKEEAGKETAAATDAGKSGSAESEAGKSDAGKSATADSEAAKSETGAAGAEAPKAADADAATKGAAEDKTAAAPDATTAPKTGADAATGEGAATAAKSAEGQAAENKEAAAGADAASADKQAAASEAPSFDVVRVEPTGEAVVAGLAAPKATVEVLDGSTTVGKGEANERGEWAIVVEKPLPPGTHDLSIRTTSPDGKTQALSEQRVAIEVPEPGKGDALVVLNAPDAPSRVMQVPGGEKSAPGVAKSQEQQVATAEPSQTPAGTAPQDSAAAAADKAAPGSTDNAQASQPAAPASPAGQDAAAAKNDTAPAAPDAAPAPSGNTAAAPANAGAAPSPKAEAAAQPAVAPKVTVDAVEFENGTIYIAGSAATGGTVRIYVDGVAVGDVATDDGGRWLLEKKHEMKPGQHTVRADQIDKDTGNVVVRAEVPFEQSVDVAILAPVTTEGGGSAGASGAGTMPGVQNVIIRRGDNLWTISRRLYGKGVRFSTIYEANTDQIRDPHWIYPGQIFVLPAGDARWTN